MKPTKLPKIDKAYIKEVCDKMLPKMKRLAVKQAGRECVGEVTYDMTDGDDVWFQVESACNIADMMGDLFKNVRFTRVKACKEYEGSYDWRADVYIKPVSIVIVEFDVLF